MAVKNPDEEKVTEAEAGVQAQPASTELRAGLATGSQAANPDQPDGHVLQTSVVASSPDKATTADLSVVVKDDGKKGPAA
jgi:hypothetical protein